MWTRRHPPRAFWQYLALIALPSAALIGLEIYHATAILPDLARSQAAVAHTFRVIDAARALDQSIQDAERGQRGFIITGEAKYLEPYTKGIAEAPARLAELQRLTADNPEQQKRLLSLEQQMNLKFSELKQTIDIRQNEGFDAARHMVETNIGQDTMHAISDLLGFAISAEYKLLTERETRAAEDQRTSALLGIAAQVLALAVLGIGVLVLIVNIRRITKAREASAQSEERFRLLVEGARDYALYMLDPDGNVASWNSGAQRMKGYTAADIIGRNFACFFTADDVRAGLPDQHLRTAAMEDRYEHEGWRVRKDGSKFWANTVLTALREPDGSLRGFVKITRDISERRHQQEALERTQATLAQVQKMEAVGQLTGGVAHDFNNLLTVIQGSLELVERQGGRISAEILARLLGPARSAAERGAALTQRLLAFSRQQALAPQDIDINAHVGSMSELLRRTLGETVAIETVLAGGLWRCFVDPSQLENALLNLAVNARDAMPTGGKLTIETGNAHLDEEYVAAHSEVTAGQYVMVAISDTGSGMDAPTIARAFEPFFTTKAPGKGTGLGLSQVYGFVKQSGGHIKIYSELGHGTTVKIYLPRHLSEGARQRMFERSTSAMPANGEIVLLVEDDHEVREFATAALTHLGYRVLEAADAGAALSILSEHSEIALLLTDVVLPGLNGRQLADEARRLVPNLKVVYTTGYARNAIVHHGVLDRDVDLLAKPFTADGLGRKLQEVLRKA